ncbi:MAG: hypothetical protein K9G70_00320 [Prolixibacteraceae bacterium]|nr:hypothetical protein [Prolixibacteraceae bacterium]
MRGLYTISFKPKYKPDVSQDLLKLAKKINDSFEDIKDWNIDNPDWNFLNRLKRQPDKSLFYYWYQTVELLKV